MIHDTQNLHIEYLTPTSTREQTDTATVHIDLLRFVLAHKVKQF